MPDIVLCTLNARYIHSALGLRYLLANMHELTSRTVLREYVINARPIDIAEDLLGLNPRVVGIGVYIWNIEQVTQVVALLKQINPEILVVLGGPELSYEIDAQPVAQLADYVIAGPADHEFHALVRQLLDNSRPAAKVIQARLTNLNEVCLPYRYYTDEDIAHRVIYVEASRGCPYKCEFCLSALDKTVWPFNIDMVLDELRALWDRGARQFKFVDRTFNLKLDSSLRILHFFLARVADGLFLHFEFIPDHLPDRLKAVLALFPPGSVQLEVGIQTLNSQVQALISRKQDNEVSLANLRWLREHSRVHIHADLIVGLPGESTDSFAQGFNALVAAGPHEIQVGILKRLRGSPIIRHTGQYRMRFNPHPPYNVLCTSAIDFPAMQRLSRFARYWDIIANSGRFIDTLPLLLADDPFRRFLALCDWLFAQTNQTHGLALARLFDLLHTGLREVLAIADDVVEQVLWRDYLRSGLKKVPVFAPKATKTMPLMGAAHAGEYALKRQKNHINK